MSSLAASDFPTPSRARSWHARILLVATAALGILSGRGDLKADSPDRTPAIQVPTPALAREAPEAGASPRALDLLTSIDRDGAARVRLTRRLLGDLDAMRERRMVRALVTYNHTHYFLDGPRQRGITYESLRLFEQHLNAKFSDGGVPISVIVIPVARDELLSRLVAGYGDIAAGALTITAERRQQVDFADPTFTNVREIVVTGPRGPSDLRDVLDLSGREVWVRPSSSYWESLEDLNARLQAMERPPVIVRAADEALEDEDLLEMVSAGLLGITVADDYLAAFWRQILPALRLHPALALRRGGELAWAVRKDSPALRREINEFVARTRAGTLTGNVLLNRYLGTTRWVRDALGRRDIDRFRRTVKLFRKYADAYDFDWLLCIAQAYQESGLDQARRSSAGAVGIMQVRPATARDPRVGIADVASLESNIHAGLKYLRWIVDTYFDDPDVDERNRLLFAFASYNAGPSRIARLRRHAASAGLDPDVWFGSVELLAARRIGDETVRYVRNIFKYYVAYRLVVEHTEEEREARERFEGAG